MKFFCTTELGNELFLNKELTERFKVDGTIVGQAFIFESELAQAIKIAYLAQSTRDVCFLLSYHKFTQKFDEEELIKKINKSLDLKKIPNLKGINEFGVFVDTNDKNIKTRAFKISNKIADSISEKYFTQKNFKVAKRKFLLEIYKLNNQYICLFGLSLFNVDLSRRTYRIFVNKTGLRPLSAFSLVLFSGIKREHKIIDFLCKDNTLMLEAYHYLSNRSVRRYDKNELINSSSVDFEFDKVFNKIDCEEINELDIFATDMAFPNIDAARKNAKIAGVAKKIKFSKRDLRFFQIAFGDRFDKAITYISLSKYKNNVIVDKIKKYVLPSVNLDLNIITNLPEEFEKRGFNIKKRLELPQGYLKLNLLKIVP